MSRKAAAGKSLAVVLVLGVIAVASFWAGVAVERCTRSHQIAPECTTGAPAAAAASPEPIQIVVEIKGPTEIPINVHAEPLEVHATADVGLHADPPVTIKTTSPARPPAPCR